MNALKLGELQASVVEVDLIGKSLCVEDETTEDETKRAEHFFATGELLIIDAPTLWRELMDITNEFDRVGDVQLRRAASALAQRVGKLF